MTISSRQVDRIAHQTGQQLQHDRDQQVDRFLAHQLEPRVETRPALAVVEVDGGRLQIRAEAQGRGPGAHQAAWREDKIAVLATMTHVASPCDPQPNLPESLCDRAAVEKLVSTIGGTGPMGPPASGGAEPKIEPIGTASPVPPTTPRTTPELAIRTYVATTASVDRFGPMVGAEARRRNFAKAAARAFLGDGSSWVWGLHRREFSNFVAIVDFLHVLVHLFTAARLVSEEIEGRWGLFQGWAEACWQGRVDEVIDQLGHWCEQQTRLNAEVESSGEDDPRQVVMRVRNYLQTNRERMDYPRYRRMGLPWTTSHVESTVKMFNRRVKGSEKFWSEAGAEGMLQLRAAFLSEDGRLDRHLKERPSSPFRNYKDRKTGKAA